MSVLKCKVCGADIQLAGDNRLATCQYCGSTMTLPRLDDEVRLAAFNRGNFFRRKGEFDQALSAYEKIVTEDPTDAEAHWCCALCRFGIEYVEDPATYEWVPTCHRVSYDDFMQDVDYQMALEYSDGIVRRQYMKDAVKISDVLKRLVAISRNEKPYDIFICYKEQDEAGGRTKDSVLAQEIYQHLTDQGYAVFFSRVTLEDKVGAEYEPYIFAALHSAKIMLVVTTRGDYASAVWVKNEWSRFLSLMRTDPQKLLIPCYKDMDPYELPAELAVMQALDLNRLGALQDLYHVIGKNISAGQEAGAAAQSAAASAAAQASIEPLLEVAFMNINANKLEGLSAKFNEALVQDTGCVRAYLGLLVCLDLERQKMDPQNWRMEWQTYLEKLKTCIPREMPESEKKIISYQTAPSLLKIYGTLQDEARMNTVLDLFPQILSGNDLLLAVCRENNVPVMKLFLDRGLPVNTRVRFIRREKNREESLLFYTVASTGSIGIARLLLERGADVKEMITENQTEQWPLLYYAVAENRRDMVELLLQNGADPGQVVCYTDEKGCYRENSALFWSIWWADADVTELILKAGISPNAQALTFHPQYGIKEHSYFTALVSAVSVKKTDTVRLLLQYGADIRVHVLDFHQAGYSDYPLLLHAILYGNGEIVKILIEAGADVNEELIDYERKTGGLFGGKQGYKEKDRYSPLYALVAEKKAEIRAWQEPIVELLLQRGADPNWAYCVVSSDVVYSALHSLSKYSGKYPVLFKAIAENCSPRVLQLLVQAGASMKASVLSNGRTYDIRHFPFQNLKQETVQAIRALGWKGKGLFF